MLIHNLFKNFLSGSMYQVHQKLLVRVCSSLEHENNLLSCTASFHTWNLIESPSGWDYSPTPMWYLIWSSSFPQQQQQHSLSPPLISPGEDCPPLDSHCHAHLYDRWGLAMPPPCLCETCPTFPWFSSVMLASATPSAIFKWWDRETHLSSFRPTELVEITGLEEMLTILKEDNLGEGFVLRWHACQQARGIPPRRTTE